MFNIVSNIIYSITQFLLNAIALIMNWIFQLIDCVGLSRSSFFGAVDRDFITNIFPKLNNFTADFTSIGYFIAFVLFVFGLFMLLFPYSDFEPPADNAFQLVFRFGVALIMVFGFEKFFLDVIYDQLIVPMFNYFNGAVGVTKSVWEGTQWFLDTLIGRISAGFTSSIGQFINLVLVIIFGLMFIVQAFKFTIYHYEKLFFTRLLIYCIPIASGTLATKKSSAIFKNYFNMLLVNCISLVINVFICGLIMSGLLNVNSAATLAATDLETQFNGGLFLTCTKTFIAGLMLLTAALKVGKKMSIYISQLFNMNGMSDAVRDGLGMFTMAVGYAGHMISQRGMKNAMKNAERNENAGDEKRAKETQASFANLQSSIDDLTNTIKEGMANSSDSDSKASKSSNAKDIQTDGNGDDNLDNPTKQADTASKPGSSEQYNNPFKENNKATDTDNNQKSADDNSNPSADKKGTQAVETDQNNPNNLNSNEQDSKNDKNGSIKPTQTDSSVKMDKNSDNSEKSSGASTQASTAQTDKDGKDSVVNPTQTDGNMKNDDKESTSSIKSENNGKAAQTDNSQVQNNPQSEKAADTDKANIQNNSKLENSENNNQSQKGVNTEDNNTSVQNRNKSEGNRIDSSQNMANGGKSVQGNGETSVNVNNNNSSHSEKKSSSQGGANISSNDENLHHSTTQSSVVQQKNTSSQHNNNSSQHSANTVTGRDVSSSSHMSGSAGAGSNISSKGNSTAQSSRVESRTNGVNTGGSNNNSVHSTNDAPEKVRSNTHGRTGSHNTKNVGGNKTEL